MRELGMGAGPRLLAGSVVAAALVAAAHAAEYHGRKAWTLRNNKIQVTVLPGGGHLASITLRSGRGAGINPLWLPPWRSVEPGAWTRNPAAFGGKPAAQLLSSIMGQNLCVDFFGAPSKPEADAGMPVHGEAASLNWTAKQVSSDRITYTTTLPAAQMRVTRTVALKPDSSAVWITETVENLSALDRPFGWNQHPTLGPPFVAAGETYFDAPGTWSQVYPKEFSTGERLKRGAEFEWPNAVGKDGESVDLRPFPVGPKNSDYTATLIDPKRKWAYFAATNAKKGLLIGYAWPRADWPWLANWEENHFRDGAPWRGQALARGMEFGTTPWAASRREAITLGKLHGVPVYRWISAKAHQTISYALFVTPVPPDTTGVKDVQVEGRAVRVSLAGPDKTVTLPLAR